MNIAISTMDKLETIGNENIVLMLVWMIWRWHECHILNKGKIML